jgi:hypothetical protein
MPFKLGKKPARKLMSTPSLGDFLDKATSWPPVAAQGWEYAVPGASWGMLGNDQWGCCAPAGILHLIQGQSSNTGAPLSATTDQCLALYSAVTGFDPNAGPSGNNPTDQGTALTDLLAYVKKNGVEMTDATGKAVTVEVVGFASLDISSIAQMRYAAYTFGGNYLGINCPQQCVDDTDNWNFASGLPIAGGHCISQEGEGAAGGKIVSWGMVIPTSTAFLLSYLEEAYCVVTKSWLDAQGASPSGLDLNGLVAAMAAL